MRHRLCGLSTYTVSKANVSEMSTLPTHGPFIATIAKSTEEVIINVQKGYLA